MTPQDWLAAAAAVIAIAAALVLDLLQAAEERGDEENRQLREWLNRTHRP